METFAVAQAIGEYAAAASKSGSGSGGGRGIIETARYNLESYIGQGNAPWLLAALLVLVVLAIVFRQRRSAGS